MGPFLRNPTAFLADARARLGDTFLLEVVGFRLFCVFGVVGLRSLYALPEDEASFGEATRTLLGLKLPPELQAGDLAMFQHLFTRERMDRVRLLTTFDLEPEFASAVPPPAQMGAVARAAAPCPVRYRRKAGA